MPREEDARRFDRAALLLPLRWQRYLARLSPTQKETAEEIRMRAGQPVTVLLQEAEIPVGEQDQSPVTPEELEQTCDRITGYSRYAATETLRSGYLTAEGGFRVGICGTAVMREGMCANLRNISSLTVRVARQMPGIAEELCPQLFPGGEMHSVLILSPPGLGKTTLLRDLIRLLSDGTETLTPRRLAVVDERGEIAAMHRGVPGMEVGCHTDVLDGCPKAIAIPILLRCANPQIIAVDEITLRQDLTAMAAAANCGVHLLATIHAADREELRQKPLFQQLLRLRVFQVCVTIRRSGAQRSYEVEEL
ncbi:MAG: stage III sporulation protein AA [Oscillospiraceae bacterium]|nr:stage III sporulation protein AA [Oscillospiraceae bacterium]